MSFGAQTPSDGTDPLSTTSIGQSSKASLCCRHRKLQDLPCTITTAGSSKLAITVGFLQKRCYRNFQLKRTNKRQPYQTRRVSARSQYYSSPRQRYKHGHTYLPINVCGAVNVSLIGESSISFGRVNLSTSYTRIIVFQNLANNIVTVSLNVEKLGASLTKHHRNILKHFQLHSILRRRQKMLS